MQMLSIISKKYNLSQEEVENIRQAIKNGVIPGQPKGRGYLVDEENLFLHGFIKRTDDNNSENNDNSDSNIEEKTSSKRGSNIIEDENSFSIETQKIFPQKHEDESISKLPSIPKYSDMEKTIDMLKSAISSIPAERTKELLDTELTPEPENLENVDIDSSVVIHSKVIDLAMQKAEKEEGSGRNNSGFISSSKNPDIPKNLVSILERKPDGSTQLWVRTDKMDEAYIKALDKEEEIAKSEIEKRKYFIRYFRETERKTPSSFEAALALSEIKVLDTEILAIEYKIKSQRYMGELGRLLIKKANDFMLLAKEKQKTDKELSQKGVEISELKQKQIELQQQIDIIPKVTSSTQQDYMNLLQDTEKMKKTIEQLKEEIKESNHQNKVLQEEFKIREEKNAQEFRIAIEKIEAEKKKIIEERDKAFSERSHYITLLAQEKKNIHESAKKENHFIHEENQKLAKEKLQLEQENKELYQRISKEIEMFSMQDPVLMHKIVEKVKRDIGDEVCILKQEKKELQSKIQELQKNKIEMLNSSSGNLEEFLNQNMEKKSLVYGTNQMKKENDQSNLHQKILQIRKYISELQSSAKYNFGNLYKVTREIMDNMGILLQPEILEQRCVDYPTSLGKGKSTELKIRFTLCDFENPQSIIICEWQSQDNYHGQSSLMIAYANAEKHFIGKMFGILIPPVLYDPKNERIMADLGNSSFVKKTEPGEETEPTLVPIIPKNLQRNIGSISENIKKQVSGSILTVKNIKVIEPATPLIKVTVEQTNSEEEKEEEKKQRSIDPENDYENDSESDDDDDYTSYSEINTEDQNAKKNSLENAENKSGKITEDKIIELAKDSTIKPELVESPQMQAARRVLEREQLERAKKIAQENEKLEKAKKAALESEKFKDIKQITQEDERFQAYKQFSLESQNSVVLSIEENEQLQEARKSAEKTEQSRENIEEVANIVGQALEMTPDKLKRIGLMRDLLKEKIRIGIHLDDVHKICREHGLSTEVNKLPIDQLIQLLQILEKMPNISKTTEPNQE